MYQLSRHTLLTVELDWKLYAVMDGTVMLED